MWHNEEVFDEKKTIIILPNTISSLYIKERCVTRWLLLQQPIFSTSCRYMTMSIIKEEGKSPFHQQMGAATFYC